MLENLIKLRESIAGEIEKAKDVLNTELGKLVNMIHELEKAGVTDIFFDARYDAHTHKLRALLGATTPAAPVAKGKRGRKPGRKPMGGNSVGNEKAVKAAGKGKQTTKELVLAILGDKALTVQQIYDRVNATKKVGKPSLGQVLVQLKKSKEIKSPKRGEWQKI